MQLVGDLLKIGLPNDTFSLFLNLSLFEKGKIQNHNNISPHKKMILHAKNYLNIKNDRRTSNRRLFGIYACKKNLQIK